jgi:MipA family protein
MRSTSTSLIALFAALSLTAAASAADLGGSKDGGYEGGGDWTLEGVRVGGILLVAPKYEGSDEYEVLGAPYILPLFAGGGPGWFSRVDARGLDDVRFKVIDYNGFVAGPTAGYTFGRDEDDGDLLEGLGDIDGGVVAGGFVGYYLGPVLFDVSYHHFFDDSDGYQIRLGAQVEKAVSDRVTLTGRIGATYADDNYMDTYFGTFDGTNVLDSEADAGFKDVHVQLGVKAELDEHWTGRASVTYSRLLDDAADSPIVESEDQFRGLVGLSYRFDVSGR